MLHRPLIITKDALASNQVKLSLTSSLPHHPLSFTKLLAFSIALRLLLQGAPKSRPSQSLWYNMREIELPTVPMPTNQL